jgi:hypothetical protein
MGDTCILSGLRLFVPSADPFADAAAVIAHLEYVMQYVVVAVNL